MSEYSLVTRFGLAMSRLDKDVHISHVESPITAAGIPDIDMCSKGKDVHIEAKFSGNGRPPEVRRSQVVWFNNRVAAGGEPWVLANILFGDSEDVVLLIEGKHMETLARARCAEVWYELAVCRFEDDEMDVGGWVSIHSRLMKGYK